MTELQSPEELLAQSHPTLFLENIENTLGTPVRLGDHHEVFQDHGLRMISISVPVLVKADVASRSGYGSLTEREIAEGFSSLGVYFIQKFDWPYDTSNAHSHGSEPGERFYFNHPFRRTHTFAYTGLDPKDVSRETERHVVRIPNETLYALYWGIESLVQHDSTFPGINKSPTEHARVCNPGHYSNRDVLADYLVREGTFKRLRSIYGDWYVTQRTFTKEELLKENKSYVGQ